MQVWCEFDPWVGKIPWRRKWQPTPVFLPGESHRERSLGVYSPWSWKNLTRLKQLSMHTLVHCGTLGRWLNLSDPQFLHPQNSDNTSLLRIKWNHVYKGLVHSTCSIIGACYCTIRASLVAQRFKCLPGMRKTWVWSQGGEDPLEKEMATHSIIPWLLTCLDVSVVSSGYSY